VPPTLTVIIPALNEAERLPSLLDALERQTRRADQIVIADADSSDGTRAIAQARGALVVDGGKPAVGRNAGARVATGDLPLFLDADDELDDDLIAGALEEFAERELAVATVHIEPIERDPRNVFACEVANLYLDVMQYVQPHAPGFCILIRRDVHEAIGGFDETIVLAEDHDYVQRAAKNGRFRVLRTVRVGTSMRRIEREGLVRLAFKYLYCELYVVTGRPIRDVPFDYGFATFEPAERSEARLAIDTLRERIGEFAQSAVTASNDGLDELRRLGSTEIDVAGFERALRGLGPDDVRRLRRYVGARERMSRRASAKAMATLRAAGAAVWAALGGDDAERRS
jgi:glycosyltransferase involved in cell wall biosynthesis